MEHFSVYRRGTRQSPFHLTLYTEERGGKPGITGLSHIIQEEQSMNNETDTIGLLVGSRRKNSFNRQLASLARTMLEEKGQKVEMIEWLDVPFFSQDDEFPTPEAVQKVRDEVMGCNVIWVFSPEYNGQIPGGEKNLLDWLSRGLKPGADKSDTAVYGRKVLLTTAGGKAAGFGVRKNLSLLCKFMGMTVISSESWGSDDVMKTPGVKEMLEGQIDTLLG